jgi:hypothetical protein
MLEPANYALQVRKGATFDKVVTYTITREGGDPRDPDDRIPQDLTGSKAQMDIRANVGDRDPLIKLTTEAREDDPHIVLGYAEDDDPDPTNGRIRIYIPADSTSPEVSTAVYDLRIDTDGDVEFLLEGAFVFKEPVTR